MSGSWVVDFRLSGREMVHVDLAAGERVAAPGPCAVVARLCGTASLDGRPLDDAPLVPEADDTFVAGPDGCRLGAVRWDAAPPAGAVRCESTDPRPMERFGSFQQQVRLFDGDRDFLAPWELYRVRMVAEPREHVEIHVHHVVTNVLLVQGPSGVRRGHLVRERAEGGYDALPLLGGDLAVVRPGLRHHVIPVAASEPVPMVVLNDAASAYEDPARADFHVVDRVAWGDVTVRDRADARPSLTVVP